MDELIIGRMIHYVLGTEVHRPAIVLDVLENSSVTLVAFLVPTIDPGAPVEWNMNCPYSEEKKPGSWHWPEKA